MSKRGEWTFEFTGLILQQASTKKADGHRQREAWWTTQLEEAKIALKASAAEFRDVPVTGGTRIELVLDPQLQARVYECQNKVNQHKQQAEEYELFSRAFATNSQHTFQVDADDVRFFGL